VRQCSRRVLLCACCLDHHLFGGAECRNRIAIRLEFHCRDVAIVQLGKLAIDIDVVDFAGARFVAARHVGDVDQADHIHVLFQFLDQLPRVLSTKAQPHMATGGTDRSRIEARALEGTLHQRQATITYYSKSSDRTKDYLVHPYRLAYAQGALYLLAYVPEYQEVRTFAMERIRELSLLEETFTPIEELPEEAFPHSLGVHSGPPERIELEFQPAVAGYVRARTWHPSQHVRDLENGGVAMTLDVCRDRALQSWILSFGPFARVVAPGELAREIAAQFEEARAQYQV